MLAAATRGRSETIGAALLNPHPDYRLVVAANSHEI